MRNDTNFAVSRRDVLKASGAMLASSAVARPSTGSPKSVVVIGAGIAGLSCAYELMKRGHDVTVLEASGRAGGHVRTFHDPFADGLYADIGAEHFYYPGYTTYWRYLKEFELTALPYPHRENMVRYLRGKPMPESELHGKAVLSSLGFNPRERDFLAQRMWADLPLLYVQKYVDQIQDERNPFVPGLSGLDKVTMRELLQREGASAAAVEFFGGSNSALQMIWGAAIKKLRGTDLETKKVFRLKGGNQMMTDAFAARLRERIHYGCPVTAITHGSSGATVTYREFGEERERHADYLVSCISLVALRQIPVTPVWPQEKALVIQEMPYYTRTRIVFQSRTRFWETDKVSPNWYPPYLELSEFWAMADEVNTRRGILIAGGQAGTTPAQALAAFMKVYPGKSADIEQTIIHDWSKDPWSGMCERVPYRLGELSRFWPEVTRPCGRVYFAGAYAGPMSWGQEAALESANLAAEQIHAA